MQERLARGHNANLEPVANWDIPTLAGAGALRSTANDLVKFLEMSLGNQAVAAGAGHGHDAGRAPSDRAATRGGRAWLVPEHQPP